MRDLSFDGPQDTVGSWLGVGPGPSGGVSLVSGTTGAGSSPSPSFLVPEDTDSTTPELHPFDLPLLHSGVGQGRDSCPSNLVWTTSPPTPTEVRSLGTSLEQRRGPERKGGGECDVCVLWESLVP